VCICITCSILSKACGPFVKEEFDRKLELAMRCSAL